jgi:hypothetical protein
MMVFVVMMLMRVPMIMAVTVVMPVVMPVVVSVAKDERTNQIDDQSENGNDHGFLVVDWLRRDDPFDGTKYHQSSNSKQEDRTGKAAQDLNLPSAEGKPGIASVFSGGAVGNGTQANGHGMGTHVPAISQQRHGVVPPAGEDFDHHHRGGNPHHETRTALGGLVARIENVVV